MLGIKKSKQKFELSAHGKHPAFSDYFSLNTSSPLASALSTWVENAVKLTGDIKKNRATHSFRFWMKGINKHELVLGIIRDSSDRMGRSYPLLIMGKGIVKDWEMNWQYIFYSSETVFRAFEDIVASRYESFKEFETKLSRVRFPRVLCVEEKCLDQTPAYSGMGERSRLPEAMKDWYKKELEKGALALYLPIVTLLDNCASYPMEMKKPGLFRKKTKGPGAVFLGGLPENPGLTIYGRPLKTDDFFHLFNVPHRNNNIMDN